MTDSLPSPDEVEEATKVFNSLYAETTAYREPEAKSAEDIKKIALALHRRTQAAREEAFEEMDTYTQALQNVASAAKVCVHMGHACEMLQGALNLLKKPEDVYRTIKEKS